ncbi:MAG: hypothetical protein LBJ19_01845 [Holosporaceae bacterium]|jgi:Ran GTPase-activating protein (RanGAP) involved in mRNA processing and transport|nr:hypothetical protein [Holosporaceae bacterium]
MRDKQHDDHDQPKEKEEVGKPTATSDASLSGVGVNQSEESVVFQQLQQKINDNKKIIALRFKKESIVYISSEGTFYEEKLRDEKTGLASVVSKIDCMSKYPKLSSVEFQHIKFSKKLLEDVISYIPKNIRLLSFTDCIFREKIKEEEDTESKSDPSSTGTSYKNDGNDEDTSIADASDDIGVKLLCDIMKRCSSLTHIILKLPTLTDQQLEIVGACLKKCSRLVSLNIVAGTMGNKSCEHLATTIENLSETLTCVALGCDRFSVPDEESLKKILVSMKSIKNPEYIGISINNIKATELSQLFGSVKNLHRSSAATGSEKKGAGLQLKLFVGNLKTFDRVMIFRNAETLSESLKSMKHLAGLDISGMNLNEKAMLAIINSLDNCTNLRALNLSNNVLNADCASKLGDVLKKVPKLDMLSMCGCFCSKEKEKSSSDSGNNISRILISTPKLKFLYLSNNNLGETMKSIQIKNLPELQLIDLSDNSCNKSEDLLPLLEQATDHPKLHVVNLHNNLKLYEEAIKARAPLNKHSLKKNIVAIFGL